MKYFSNSDDATVFIGAEISIKQRMIMNYWKKDVNNYIGASNANMISSRQSNT